MSNLKVLYLRFEDLLADLEGAIRKIADFCEVAIREEEMPRILDRCSFDFMRRHEEKLDVRTRKFGDLDPANGHFVRKGKAGGWIGHFDPEMQAQYNRLFERRFGRHSVFEAYRIPADAPGLPDSRAVSGR